jgi:AcrB/AcrD/AcrF family
LAIESFIASSSIPEKVDESCSSVGGIVALWARGIGSDAQGPLATVVVGGLLSTLFLTLLALPSLYYLMNRRRGETCEEGGLQEPDELPADSVDQTEKVPEEVLAD